VAHPVHEFTQAGPGLTGQGVAGMPQVVKVDADEPGCVERRTPDPREVAAAELGTFRAGEDQAFGVSAGEVVQVSGRWVGLGYDGRVMTEWSSMGKTREESERTMTALMDSQGVAYIEE
jgi:hypothetical protein